MIQIGLVFCLSAVAEFYLFLTEYTLCIGFRAFYIYNLKNSNRIKICLKKIKIVG